MSGTQNGISRRNFLKLVGLTGAGAVAGCMAPPADRLMSYVTPPDDQIVGLSTWYATTCQECSAGCGIHVFPDSSRALYIHEKGGGRDRDR